MLLSECCQSTVLIPASLLLIHSPQQQQKTDTIAVALGVTLDHYLFALVCSNMIRVATYVSRFAFLAFLFQATKKLLCSGSVPIN